MSDYFGDRFSKAVSSGFEKDIDFGGRQGSLYLTMQQNAYAFARAKARTIAISPDRLDSFDLHLQWAETEENHFVASGQAAQKWLDIERDAEKLPYLVYRTAEDEFVRESHKLLDGVVLPVGHEFWETHIPPLGYNCRCQVQQKTAAQASTMKRFGETPPEVAPDKPMFANNPGKSGLAFLNKHPYFKNINTVDVEAYRPVYELGKAMENQAEYMGIASPWVKDYFSVKGGGYVVAHEKALAANEYKENLGTGKIVADNGGKVRLLQHNDRIAVNQPDAEWNGYVTEFKVLESKSSNAASNALRKANKQAPNVLMRLRDDFDTDELANALESRLYRTDFEQVTFIYKGKVFTYAKRALQDNPYLVENIKG